MILSNHRDDCGVCALANAFAISWTAAVKKIFPNGHTHKKRLNTTTKAIVAALGGGYKLKRVDDWKHIPDGSVVKVIPAQCEGTGNWHWVAWRAGKVWCTYNGRTMRPHEFKRMRLVSYLAKDSGNG